MKETADLLMENKIQQRPHHVRINSKGNHPDVVRSRVGIEDLVELFSLVAGGLNNLALPKVETNSIEGNALINCGCVECDMAFDGSFYRRCEHFAVRNIPVATANHRWNSFDAKS